MATIYYSPSCKAGSGIQPRAGLGICSVSGQFNIATDGGGVAFVDEDIIQLVKIPKGATVLDVIMDVPALESSTALRWGLGDDGDTDRYIVGNSTGISGAGGIVRAAVAGGTQYKYTADNTIDMRISTVANGTPVTVGIIKCTVLYTLDA